MSVIIFFSANKNNLFCRNDVQAIDFLRKGSYAPENIEVISFLFEISSAFQKVRQRKKNWQGESQ
jgi:hypothetical protein